MNKKYWFLVYFVSQNCSGTIIHSRDKKNIDNASLDEMRSFIEDTENAIKPLLTSVSYLGYMTKEEFYGE